MEPHGLIELASQDKTTDQVAQCIWRNGRGGFLRGFTRERVGTEYAEVSEEMVNLEE